MRYVVMTLALTVAACAPQQQQSPAVSALGTTYELYKQCLAAMPPERCETPRARYEAARSYADSVSRDDAARAAARPPIIFQPYIPPPIVQPPRQIICTTSGNMTSCY